MKASRKTETQRSSLEVAVPSAIFYCPKSYSNSLGYMQHVIDDVTSPCNVAPNWHWYVSLSWDSAIVLTVHCLCVAI